MFGSAKRDALEEDVGKAEERMAALIPEDGFTDPRAVEAFVSSSEGLVRSLKRQRRSLLAKLFAPKSQNERFGAFLENLGDLEKRAEEHDGALARSLLPKVREEVNPVEGRELTDEQLYPIAYETPTRLVVAGAGTGKTLTIVGLVKHILKSGLARPEEVLVVSFTNATVDELRGRLERETGETPVVSTFHGLGMSILTGVEGKRPRITGIQPEAFVADLLDRVLLHDARFVRDLGAYMLSDRKGEAVPEDGYRSIRGERTKSLGETEIADWLMLNGIAYEYEGLYEEDVRDADHAQYRPDFHIAGTKVYIEFFGVGMDGNVPDWFTAAEGETPSETYRKGMEWKREVHREHGTTLVELFDYERVEGTLLDCLEDRLASAGVVPKDDGASDVAGRVRGMAKARRVAPVLASTLQMIRNSGLTFDEAFDRAGPSMRRFRKVMKPVVDAYEAALAEEGSIDFSDMLGLSRGMVEERRWTPPYRYVVVDEYQDIAPPSYRLLKAMRDARDFSLFCVGDDWQSIYRFNGSDVGYMLDFGRWWGPHREFGITLTRRYSGRLLECSSRFVSMNPRQIRKSLRGPEDRPGFIADVKVRDRDGIGPEVLDRVSKLPKGASVLMLGRFNRDVDPLMGSFGQGRRSAADGVELRCPGRDDLTVRFRTVHGSKGLEADYVFLLNTSNGTYGFPCTIEEAPMTRYLLDGDDDYPFAEERRLFYVAVTRARREVFLVLVDGDVSPFVGEFEGVSNGDHCRL